MAYTYCTFKVIVALQRSLSLLNAILRRHYVMERKLQISATVMKLKIVDKNKPPNRCPAVSVYRLWDCIYPYLTIAL